MHASNTTRQVFISHASQNAAVAQRICRLLEERGVTCWIAPRDVPPGSIYADAILKGIEQSTAMVLILSPEANQSQHVATETERAFSKHKLIIPLRMNEVAPGKALEYFLSSAQRVDLWPEPIDAKMNDIVQAISARCGLAAESLHPSDSSKPTTPPQRRSKAQVLGMAAAVALFATGAFVYLTQSGTTPPNPRAAQPDTLKVLRDALALSKKGDDAAARVLLCQLGGTAAESSLVRAVGAYLDQDRRAKSQQELRALIHAIEQHKTSTVNNPAAECTPPRVLACLGPISRDATESDALLLRICLRSELEKFPGMILVERESLDAILKEMNLGASALADSRAATTIGKILPAGLLLVGDLLPTQEVFLRLVDTETSRVLGSLSGEKRTTSDIQPLCNKLAAQIRQLVIQNKPLRAQLANIQGNMATAPLGRYQGLVKGMRFSIQTRQIPVVSDQSQFVGRATTLDVSENSSTFTLEWKTAAPPQASELLWLQESID